MYETYRSFGRLLLLGLARDEIEGTLSRLHLVPLPGVGVEDGLQQLSGLVTFADVDEVRPLRRLAVGGGVKTVVPGEWIDDEEKNAIASWVPRNTPPQKARTFTRASP